MNHTEQAMTPSWRAWPVSGGEAGTLIRLKDWSKTSLGSRKHWPQSIRSALDMCLRSAAPMAVCWGDELHLFYNDAWKNQLGDSYAPGMGVAVQEAFNGKWEELESLVERVFSTGEAQEFEEVPATAPENKFSGSSFDVALNPIIEADGSVVGILSTVSRTRIQLKKSRSENDGELSFSEMVDALPVPAYTTDAKGRLTYYNPAAERFCGRVPEPGSDRWCITWKLYHPDGRPMPHDACPMAVALKEGHSISGARGIAERPDGERIHFEAYPSPLYNEKGEMIGGINMLFDVTGHKQAEQALCESEKRLRFAFEAGETGSWDWNIESDTITWSENLEEIHGMNPKEFDGRFDSFINAVHPDDRNYLRDMIRQAVEEDKPYHVEHRWVLQDGEVIWLEGKGQIVRDETGRAVRMIGTCMNITERKRMEQSLRESEAQLEADLEGYKLLQSISSQLIEEKDIQTLYERILDAAATIMQSKCASLQMFHPEQGKDGKLRLLASRGFNQKAKEFWEWVSLDSGSSCGETLRVGERVIVQDVKESDFVAGTEDLEIYLQAGIRSVQTTPLVSRNGQILGMISTHWSEPHTPSERDLRMFDILVRQAADIVEQRKAEDILRRSEEKYRNLFERIDEGFAIAEMLFDRSGQAVDYRFLEVNSAFERHTGLKNAQGRRMRELAPDIEQLWTEAYGEVALTGNPVRFEDHSEALDRWFNVYAFRVGEPDDRKVALLFSDITERKQSEYNNSLLGAIVDGSDDAIISKNLDSVVMSWNAGAERMFGFTAEEMIGQLVTSIVPEDRLDEEKQILEQIRQGEKVDQLETVRLHKDGTPLYVSLTVSPVRDPSGKIVGASKIARDITERKRAYQALQDSENRLQTKVSDMERLHKLSAQLLSLDDVEKAMHTVMMASAELLQADKATVQIYDEKSNRLRLVSTKGVPQELKDQFPTVDVDDTTTCAAAFREGAQILVEDLSEAPEFAEFCRTAEPYSMRAALSMPLYIGNGRLFGVFTVYWDRPHRPAKDKLQLLDLYTQQAARQIERKRAQKDLRDMNEALEERVAERTASLVAYQEQLRSLAFELSKAEERERQQLAAELHDNLGQMLAVGKMKLDLLRRAPLPEPAAGGAEEVAGLVDEAIRYTRELMSELKPPPSLEKESLATSIRWVAGKMQKHGLDVTIEDDGLPKPLEEEIGSTLLQCTRELLFNVVKHAGVDQAHVKLTRRDNRVCISVEDQGRGFDLEGARPAPTESGGFGLFNVLERIDLLGGELDVDTAPGKGTRISLKLPLKDESKVTGNHISASVEGEGAMPGSPEKSAGATHKVRVLLADDHRLMREGLRKLIEEEKDITVVAEAMDGKEAVRLAEEVNPDVIVMDVNMPGMDGIEATRRIRAADERVRIIGLSLQQEQRVARAMRRAGASAYLTKADVFETLCAAIRSEAAMARNGERGGSRDISES